MSSPETNINAPTIKFTRKRTTTKTRTAATSARRRKNLPLVHASGGEDDTSGKDAHSWFARKSTMMTDQQIRSHLVSGGAKSGGEGVSFIGDMIIGAAEEGKKRKRRGGPRFAWEEEEDDASNEVTHRMAAAPTLMDIMDEKDEVDLMSPLKVSKAFSASDANVVAASSKKRNRSEALAHLAIFSDVGSSSAPTGGNSSIGWNLLRVWGYRSRLGVALVPLSGFDKSDKCLIDSLDKNATHEAKWLATKRLRAIHLPSVQNNADANAESASKNVDIGVDNKKKAKLLVIPPPKINRHGIGYDPFKNAPEFRAFHEQRKRMAEKHGREDTETSVDKTRQHRYLTDDLRGAKKPWDTKSITDKDDFDDDSVDNQHDARQTNQDSHYAAERNFEHLIGSKASSGFALDDADDANMYDGGDHILPQRNKQDLDGEMSNYAMEVQSPVASDEEDMEIGSSLFGGHSNKKSKSTQKDTANGGENLADAWSSWGLGADGSGATKAVTQDGKPTLAGFVLGGKFLKLQSNTGRRWEGPKVPPGYVLKRHVFTAEDISEHNSDNKLDRTDFGLGLELQAPQHHKQSTRSALPKVLPESEPQKVPAGKLLAKDGTALNFHAVRESMKNRFVSGSTSQDSSEGVTPDPSADFKGKDEWVNVTISTWMPARLLCKRWGVPIPADYKDDISTVKRSGEEEYFQKTVYDPTVAKKRKQDANMEPLVDTKKQSALATEPPVESTPINEEATEDDRAAPNRPSESVFQSIFDVESDLDVSDEENDIVNADILQHANEVNEFGVHGRARKKRHQTALGGERSEPNVANQAEVAISSSLVAAEAPNAHVESSSNVQPSNTRQDGTDSGSSSHVERRRKHEHRHRKHDGSDSDSDESKKRSRHKHRSRSSRKEKKRKKDKRR